jgi:hypothetical protein
MRVGGKGATGKSKATPAKYVGLYLQSNLAEHRFSVGPGAQRAARPAVAREASYGGQEGKHDACQARSVGVRGARSAPVWVDRTTRLY